MTQDALMDRITAAIDQLHGGDRLGARASLNEIWADMVDDPDPFHVCILSHYMADAQDDVESELAWDLRALEAAGTVTDDRLKAHHPSLTLASFYPSLHLNVGDAFLRAGNPERARVHARAAEAALLRAPGSPLAEMTRKAVAALIGRLDGPS